MIEDPKTKIIAVLAGLLVIGAGFFGLMIFLNQAKLIIKAEPPYTASVNGERFLCNADPCVIEIVKGDYSVSLEKEGYRRAEFDVVLGRRGKVEKEIEFELIPYIETLTEAEGEEIFTDPEFKPPKKLEKFAATKDSRLFAYLDKEKNKKQALYILDSNGNEEVAAYFSAPIADYDLKFLNDEKTVAIIEHEKYDSIYLIDLEVKSRKKIARNKTAITDLKCSYNGKWCFFEGEQTLIVNTENNEKKIIENLDLPLGQMIWDKSGVLFFVSEYKSETEESVFYVQKFNPETDEFVNILTTSNLQNPPEELKLDEKAGAIYLKNKDGYFAVRF